ncbi:hypothetical protein Tco_1118928, partial [Tanacetum coccineum]
PNLFLPATQVEFTFDEITFTTNNEVALVYPSHPNQDYFEAVSDFISKCCLKDAFTRALNQYKEYLSKVWYIEKTLDDSKCLGSKKGGLEQISNKVATILYCLANRVQVDHAKIIWEDLIHELNKKTREKIVPCLRFLSLLLEHMMPKYENEELTINAIQVFSLHNLTLKPNQPEEPPFTDHIKAICNLDVPVESKAPKPSSQTKEVPQVKNPRAKSGLRRKRSSKHTSESITEASKSQTGQSKKETKSSLAKDKSPSHPSPPTRVVGEMHKEAQQAAGSNPSVLVDKIKSARDGLKTAHTDSGANEESRGDDISLKVKLEDLSNILKDTRFAFFTLDSPPDEPIIVSDESEEEKEVAKDKHTEATSYDIPEGTLVPPLPSPKSAQIQELTAQVHLLITMTLSMS